MKLCYYNGPCILPLDAQRSAQANIDSMIKSVCRWMLVLAIAAALNIKLFNLMVDHNCLYTTNIT